MECNVYVPEKVKKTMNDSNGYLHFDFNFEFR